MGCQRKPDMSCAIKSGHFNLLGTVQIKLSASLIVKDLLRTQTPVIASAKTDRHLNLYQPAPSSDCQALALFLMKYHCRRAVASKLQLFIAFGFDPVAFLTRARERFTGHGFNVED